MPTQPTSAASSPTSSVSSVRLARLSPSPQRTVRSLPPFLFGTTLILSPQCTRCPSLPASEPRSSPSSSSTKFSPSSSLRKRNATSSLLARRRGELKTPFGMKGQKRRALGRSRRRLLESLLCAYRVRGLGRVCVCLSSVGKCCKSLSLYAVYCRERFYQRGAESLAKGASERANERSEVFALRSCGPGCSLAGLL